MPTLIPRPWPMQAGLSAVCVIVGYAIGALIGWGFRASSRRWGWHPRRRWRLWLWAGLGAVWLVAVAGGALAWTQWQNVQRDVMGMPRLDLAAPALMIGGAALAVILLLLVGRLLRRALGALVRYSRRVGRGHPAAPAVALAGMALVVLVCGMLAFEGLTRLATWHYGAENDSSEAGIAQPRSPEVSGSPDSLVPWSSLGRQGRTFVSETTTPAELAAFNGDAPLVSPVRVYAGIKSADTLEARASLAVRELERAGGFDRAVIAVWIPTGTGWMISESADALEQLYGGNSAIVGIQYSVLPSLFTVFMKPGEAAKAGTALFNAVEQRWSELPEDQRPKLLLFGKSLGTEGVEAPFAASDGRSSVGNLVARTDGALIVGATYVNPLLTQLTREREPGSPVWAPVFDQGRSVRFVSGDPHQHAIDSPWLEPRIVYLQHPSDPVPYWGIDAIWKPPEWLDAPRGYGVPAEATWFPIVTAILAVSDQIDQLSPPDGFGHNYGTDYVQGWSTVVPPTGWTAADTRRLEEYLAHHEYDELE
ncbi:hypothetical protein D9V29_14055 [Mycetocola manganoxydans]|uniref:Alpha/beta-hydrolase catalytic domain-containing protein n=2 Tax=Mycetocola manganoxydans TaxID=699879 RepID=A0A3L6ZJW5_9MICO|nr:alpha/beta-hydrolase family protein [Mycetocola manganoxydans]RLP68284.1 hypothetical protein D9V29_14055 [Mycetocola manganoxydans]